MQNYEPGPFTVRLRWNDDRPLPATAVCECSGLMPQAIIMIEAEVPAEWGSSDPSWTFFVRVNPPFGNETARRGVPRFEVWQNAPDTVGWSAGEFGWSDDQVSVANGADDSDPLDDLSDALYERAAQKVFSAFARLRGGQIEFAAWS